MDVVTPVIVSASRATDIPALYGEWLLRRLRAGWCVRVNPFNRRPRRVSFERVRVIVFWSKNPAPLIPRLGEIEDRGIGSFFTLTLNDYEREGLEPGVPPLPARVDAFLRLSERLGRERVVWRFDPILVGPRLSPEAVLERIARVGSAVHRHTRRLVVSFADIARYPAVRRRLESGGNGWGEPTAEQVVRLAAGIGELARGWGLEAVACAEATDLGRWGIGRSRCIDDGLLARAFPGDGALLAFLGRGCAPVPARPPAERRRSLGARAPLTSSGKHGRARSAHPLKDRGQRAACGCIVSADIGRYGTCTHGCAYCYANASHAAAAAAHRRHDPEAESL